ncbi:STAS/SEC14 domain-containing protein [bacterium]|nr:STAS/SEC14 domain-containing protein [bacterium]
MIERLKESAGSFIGFRVSGKISLGMEKEWLAHINKVIEEHGKISIIVHLDDHPSWGLKAGIEDLKWVMTHIKQINKLAIVSDSNFWKWYVALDRPFGKLVGVGEEYFKPEDMDAAWKWIKS